MTDHQSAVLDLGGDDLEGVVFSLVFSLVLIVVVLVAAPVIVVLLAILLFSLEPTTGAVDTERYRLVWNAVRRVRAVNHDRRVRVRWAWA